MKIELLAPAKDVCIARSAIVSGADAIYIGGDGFGARVGASNSMLEIGGLVEFAHKFGVRVYLTMNTILYDNELEGARKQALAARECGVDALIVQDMAYLEMGLPIELHASTQMFNFSAEKVKFLEDAGFARVVLERGLSLAEIREIRSKSGVELEAFVHGAICVGYSGQCYLSQAVTGRSGNRGECAQLCRSRYDLVGSDGALIAKNDSVLSVGDMCMADRVKDMIDAGICSLKIEGRLKNESYVVNNTAYYNRILNDLGVERASDGYSVARFEPNPGKSFLRKPTHYFFDNKRNKVGAPSKSLGELIGVVESVNNGSIVVSNGKVLNNGDGICWLVGGDVEGANVNKVEGNSVIGRGLESVMIGDEIFRNQDIKFDVSSKDVSRKIAIKVNLGSVLEATDEAGNRVEIAIGECEVASNRDRAIDGLKSGLSKSGDTIFEVTQVQISSVDVPFMPSSKVNELRRELLCKLEEARLNAYVRRDLLPKKNYPKFDFKSNYLLNVSNDRSGAFYRKCGVENIEDAIEKIGIYDNVDLLRSRFCVRREKGICPKEMQQKTRQNQVDQHGNALDMTIINNGRSLRLTFDCNRCEMIVKL